MMQVVRAVFFQQFIQTALGYWWMDEPDATTDHLREMQSLLVRIGGWLTLALGTKSAGAIMQLHGSAIAWWTYWWTIPTMQFFFAMWVSISL